MSLTLGTLGFLEHDNKDLLKQLMEDAGQLLQEAINEVVDSGFPLCVPSSCQHASGVMAVAAVLLSLRGGLLDGERLVNRSRHLFEELQLQGPTDELNEKCWTSDIQPRQTTEKAAVENDRWPSVKLNSGFELPLLIFGTGGLADRTSELVLEALRVGFRGLDTATHPEDGSGFDYDQPGVRDGLARSLLPRSSVFILTKVHPADFGYLKTLRAVKRAVAELSHGSDAYIDLILLHFPTCHRELCPPGGILRPIGDFVDAWRGLEEAVSQGLVRSIGVSNFDAQQLQQLLQAARVAPAVAGLWADAFQPVPRALGRLCGEHGVRLQVFGVLGFEWSQGRGATGKFAPRSSPLLDHPVIKNVAARKGWSEANVLITFFTQQGISVITSSRDPDRMRQVYLDHDARRLRSDETEEIMDLQGFLHSSISLQHSPDFYHGMVGFDTHETTLLSTLEVQPAWNCERMAELFSVNGVVHLPSFLPMPAVASARRAAQKLVWDHGGGHLEDRGAYPEALCKTPDFLGFQLDSTQLNFIFPAVAFLRPLVECLLGTENPVLYYLLLRAKARDCGAAEVPWHQDLAYVLPVATKQNTYDAAEPDLTAFAERSLTLHVPLTEETIERSALVYILGSHHEGLHEHFWVKGWLGPYEPAYDYSADHPRAKIIETKRTDLLAHSTMVHHGSPPNPSKSIRWHLELGVQDAAYAGAFQGHRTAMPPDLSLEARMQFLGEMPKLRPWP